MKELTNFSIVASWDTNYLEHDLNCCDQLAMFLMNCIPQMRAVPSNCAHPIKPCKHEKKEQERKLKLITLRWSWMISALTISSASSNFLLHHHGYFPVDWLSILTSPSLMGGFHLKLSLFDYWKPIWGKYKNQNVLKKSKHKSEGSIKQFQFTVLATGSGF